MHPEKGKSKKISLDIVYCETLLLKIKGLMFSKVLPKGHALLIPSNNGSIHTFFMRFNIDVFWLDKNFIVVDLRRNIRPWMPLISPRTPVEYILEVPSVYGYKIKVGDVIQMIK